MSDLVDSWQWIEIWEIIKEIQILLLVQTFFHNGHSGMFNIIRIHEIHKSLFTKHFDVFHIACNINLARPTSIW